MSVLFCLPEDDEKHEHIRIRRCFDGAKNDTGHCTLSGDCRWCGIPVHQTKKEINNGMAVKGT